MTVEKVPTPPEVLVRRFFWHGSVSHLVDLSEPLPPGLSEDRRPAVCGTRPYWPGVWWGDDPGALQSDERKASDKPICSICARAKGANGDQSTGR